MNTIEQYLKDHIKTCIGNDNKVVEVVEYNEAITALHNQKAYLIAWVKNLILNVKLAQAIGLDKDWEQIFNKQINDL